MLLLLEFDFNMRDRKGSENQVTDHLSRLESPSYHAKEEDISDKFPDKAVMGIATVATPWYANLSNYLVCEIMPNFSNPHQKRKLLYDVKNYY